MSFITSKNFSQFSKNLQEIIANFNSTGQLLGNGKRNKIKLFDLNGKTINIKSFKKPNLINQLAYRYLRKSKAKRSFEFATYLLERGVGTPEPIAYAENFELLGLQESFYISEHLKSDLTFRELVEIPDFPEHDKILRLFTQFSYDLHKKGIEFKDHSPGNTLILKNENGDYDFFLVDLNRMEFHKEMSFDLRMKNLSRLTPKKEMIVLMSNEYAKSSGESEEEIFNALWRHTTDFQYKFSRKKRLKKKFLFWR